MSLFVYGYDETSAGVRRPLQVALTDVSSFGNLFFYAYRLTADGVRFERRTLGSALGSLPSDVYIDVFDETTLGIRHRLSVVASSIGGAPSAPVNTALPTFTGTMTAGQTLTYVPGTWTGAPSVTWVWKADGVSIQTGGATLDTTGQGAKNISITETATNAQGTTNATSLIKYVFVSDTARIFVARFAVEPPSSWKAAYDTMYVTSGFTTALAKLDALYAFGGPDQQASLLNLAGNNTAILTGTLVHQPSIGYASNGNNNYIDSGLDYSTLSHLAQDSTSVFVYVKSSTGVVNQVAGVALASNRLFIEVNDGSNNTIGRVNNATSFAGANGGVINGLFTLNRTASNLTTMYGGTTSLATSAVASAPPIAGNMTFFRNVSSYTIAGATILQFGGFGAQLTTTDIGVLNSAFAAFIATVAPRQFLFIGSGQSNMHRIGNPAAAASGDGSVGSDAMTRVFIPLLTTSLNTSFTDKPNVLTALCFTVSWDGSSVDDVSFISNYWWEHVGVSAGPRLITWDGIVNALPSLANHRAIVIGWAQCEAEVETGEVGAPFANWKADTKLMWAHMRATLVAKGFAGTIYIVIQPVGANTAVDQTRLALFRTTQNVDFPAEVANLSVAPATTSITRVAPDDWHAVSFVVSTNGYDKMATDLAATVGPLMAL